MAPSLRRKSGVSTSMRGAGAVARGWRGSLCAKCSAPPSARSSRSTEVMTTCLRPSFVTARPTLRRLVGIQRAGQSRLHVAEGAGARAGVAHDHHGGVAMRPAFADIRAGRLLAHRVQIVLAHDGAGLGIFPAHRRLDPDPVRLAQDRQSPAGAPFRDGEARGPWRCRSRLSCRIHIDMHRVKITNVVYFFIVAQSDANRLALRGIALGLSLPLQWAWHREYRAPAESAHPPVRAPARA